MKNVNGKTDESHKSCGEEGTDKTILNNVDDEIEIEIQKTGLKRTIGFTAACAIIVSNTGGASIFIAPTTVLIYSGSQGVALILWACGGIIQLGMAMTVMELALMFPNAGGTYFYVYETFGELPGFILLWGFTIFIPGCGWALSSYSSSLYILSMIWTDCPPPKELVLLVAMFIIVSLIALNCTYTNLVAQVQKFLTSSKLLAMLIVTIIGLLFIPSEMGQENIKNMMDGTHADMNSLSMGLFAGFFSYGGWQVITLLAEEIKKPEKVMPRSMVTSFAIIIVAYVSTIFSYGVILSKQDMLKSDAIAVQFGNRVHWSISMALSILVVLCNCSSLNTMVMGQPRMLYAAARNGQMPQMMKLLHKKFKTPWPATFFLGMMGFTMLQHGSIMILVDSISMFAGVQSVMVMMCLLYLRWARPDIHRPFKMPIILPIMLFLLTVVLILLSVITKPKQLGFVALVISMAVPVYCIFIKWQKPCALFRLVDVFTKYLALSLNLE